ncbi:hypothetical protein Loa_02326 [Legionella oakridgensis ATCC 33761 = DSM 21215]|uniref:Uncharacterized protein n=1 Tax=Legionella oakridgensis ATCC 33761 = DSM 21215 TaxID=1268635 RepID=W0BBH0_9GAMM|nr:AI-2E family transporter [Legionella oakridgensis]AHE67868.1 hypothetical protein Loa_02326 [Legionella oakridgensis ATCC 33761 = DSM 21215]
MNRTVTFAAGLVLVWITGYLLITGRGLLIPLIIAIFIWNLLNTIHGAIQRAPVVGARLPYGLSMSLSLVVVVIFVKIVIDIISNNVNDVISASSRYQENLMRILNALDTRYQIKTLASFDSFFKELSVQHILANIYGVFTTLTGSAVLIALYVVFYLSNNTFLNKNKRTVPATRASPVGG